MFRTEFNGWYGLVHVEQILKSMDRFLYQFFRHPGNFHGSAKDTYRLVGE
jgi:hypothetical protein